MAKIPKISVIVPVYRAEKYLRECIDSIIRQSFSDFELILVDDGSPDGSGTICDKYAKQYPFISVIHQQNGGQTRARKAGVKKAKGEYIMLVDADDWLAQNALEVLYKTAEKDGSDIVTCDSYFHFRTYKIDAGQPLPGGVFNKKRLLDEIYPKMLYSGRFFYFGIYAAMWNKLFKASLLRPNLQAVNDNVKVGEDGLTTYGAFLDATKVSIIHDKLYHYRNYNDSITRSYVPEQFNSTKLLISSLRSLSKAKNVYDLSDQIDYYLMYNVRSIFEEEFQHKSGHTWAQKHRYLSSVMRDKEVRAVTNKISTSGMNRWSRVFFSLLSRGNVTLVMLTTWSYIRLLKAKSRLRQLLRLHRV